MFLASVWCFSASMGCLAQESSEIWKPADSMIQARHTFTLTDLGDGRFLAVGGKSNSGYHVSCEIYNIDTGRWRETGKLHDARHGHTATRLNDGRILVVGSWNGDYTASAELFDPEKESWSLASPMQHGRDRHTATLLPDGKVLVAGGFGAEGAINSVEIYDPLSDRWTKGPDLSRPTAYHSATLGAGVILFTGGEGQESNYAYATLLNLTSGQYKSAPSMSVAHAFGESATRLDNDTVLVIGGEPNDRKQSMKALRSVECYTFSKDSWENKAELLAPRFFHTATLLPGANVLVIGGLSRGESDVPRSSTEIFKSKENLWIEGPKLATGRARHCVVHLPDNSIMVAGGNNAIGRPIKTVEILKIE